MPSVYHFDVTVKGMALTTHGLTDWNTYDGYGLLTFGLLWACPDIWSPYWSQDHAPVNSWTLYATVALPIITSWTMYSTTGATITTGWTTYTTQGIEDC